MPEPTPQTTRPATPTANRKNWRLLGVIALCVVVAAGTVMAMRDIGRLSRGSRRHRGTAGASSVASKSGGTHVSANNAQKDEPACNVMGITLHGLMLTYDDTGAIADDSADTTDDVVTASDAVTDDIQTAEDSPDIKGILVEIDSGGGAPVAGQEIADALKRATKPTVAVIRQSGMSAAYWAATGAGRVFASDISDVGSIGVTASYVDESAADAKEGKTFVPLASGKYKDSGDPAKPMTADEKALMMRDVQLIHEKFVDAVAANRKLPRADVSKIADGSSVLGTRALELGLIDEIGGMPEAEAWLAKQTGAETVVCW